MITAGGQVAVMVGLEVCLVVEVVMEVFVEGRM